MKEYIVNLTDISEYGRRMIVGNGIPKEELIRCKDCGYCSIEKSFDKILYYCDAFSYHAEGDLIGVSLEVDTDHFCSWAVRREE